MLSAFGHRVAMCCDTLAVVGSVLTIFKLEPTTPNMSQHGGQTHATCCVQQCCDGMLRSFGRGFRGTLHLVEGNHARDGVSISYYLSLFHYSEFSLVSFRLRRYIKHSKQCLKEFRHGLCILESLASLFQIQHW